MYVLQKTIKHFYLIAINMQLPENITFSLHLSLFF